MTCFSLSWLEFIYCPRSGSRTSKMSASQINKEDVGGLPQVAGGGWWGHLPCESSDTFLYLEAAWLAVSHSCRGSSAHVTCLAAQVCAGKVTFHRRQVESGRDGREGHEGGGGRSGTNFPPLLSPMVSRYSDAGRQLSSAAAEEDGVWVTMDGGGGEGGINPPHLLPHTEQGLSGLLSGWSNTWLEREVSEGQDLTWTQSWITNYLSEHGACPWLFQKHTWRTI